MIFPIYPAIRGKMGIRERIKEIPPEIYSWSILLRRNDFREMAKKFLKSYFRDSLIVEAIEYLTVEKDEKGILIGISEDIAKDLKRNLEEIEQDLFYEVCKNIRKIINIENEIISELETIWNKITEKGVVSLSSEEIKRILILNIIWQYLEVLILGSKGKISSLIEEYLGKGKIRELAVLKSHIGSAFPTFYKKNLPYLFRLDSRFKYKEFDKIECENKIRAKKAYEEKLKIIRENDDEDIDKIIFLAPLIFYAYELKDIIHPTIVEIMSLLAKSYYNIDLKIEGNMGINPENGLSCLLNKREILFLERIGKKVPLLDVIHEDGIEWFELLEKMWKVGLIKKNLRYFQGKSLVNFYRGYNIGKDILIPIRFPRCNMMCKYCLRGEVKEKEDDRRMLENIEILIREISKSFEEISIVFHGGEPLLYLDLIEKVVREYGKMITGIDYSIQTNGTLIKDNKERIIKLIDKYKVRIGISLDGPRDMHDRARVYPDGSGTFDDIMEGIEILKNCGIDFGIITVIGRHNNNPSKLHRFFVSEEILHVKMNHLVPYPWIREKGLALSPKELFEFYKEFIKINWKRYQWGWELVREKNIIEWVKLVTIGKTSYGCFLDDCQAGKNHLGFDPLTGKIYLCDDFEDDKFALGNLREKGILEIMINNYNCIYHKYMDEVCRKCEIRTMCTNVCKSEIVYVGKEYMCEFFKLFIPWLRKFCLENPDFVTEMINVEVVV